MAKGRAGYSSSRSSSYRSAPSPSPSYSYRSTPSYPPVPSVPKPSFFSSMMEGFSFGTGSAIAHNTINRIFSSISPLPSYISTSSSKSCESFHKSLQECLQNHNQDKDICKEALKEFEACKEK